MTQQILCTFPGRHGDLLWALPSVRAISEWAGQPVDLQIAGEFSRLLPLLSQQPYLGSVFADPRWGLSPPDAWKAPPAWPARQPGGSLEAFMTPPDPLEEYDHVYHLGYRRWPELPLSEEVLRTAQEVTGEALTIDLRRPWITQTAYMLRRDIVFGFSDCWFELKYGLTELLFPDDDDVLRVYGTCFPPGSRWLTEGGYRDPTTWLAAAEIIAGGRIFFGDCSALHVLAVALGKPVVLVEPMEARWNPIFYPLGQDGPEVTLVKGLDGQPTFDARHCAETLEMMLAKT